MINKYDCLIVVIGLNKRLALKFKKIGDKLYAFNFYEPEEKRKLVEINSINGVPVDNFIKKIKANDLYNNKKMKKYGIDTDNELVLDIVDDDKIIHYDVYDLTISDEIFTKPFRLNDNINLNISIDFKNHQTQDNKMLDYASTNIKSLLLPISKVRSFSLVFDVFIILSNICSRFTNNLKYEHLL